MRLNSIEHTDVYGSPARRFDLTFTVEGEYEFTVPVFIDPPHDAGFITVDSTQIPSDAPGDAEVHCKQIAMSVAMIFDMDW